MSFGTQNFQGVLEGTHVNDLNKKIDYTKTKLQERKVIVEEILDGTQFYCEYFSHYFKGSIRGRDGTSDEVNVCKSLERMASYLLNSEEIKAEEDKEITKYVFHTDAKYFQKKIGREKSLEAMTETNNEGAADVIHFLQKASRNVKVPKQQFIAKEDLKRNDFLGEVLRAYITYNEFITAELKNKDTKFNRFLLTKIKGEISFDVIYSKDHLLGVWGYDLKKNSKESTKPNLDVFDFTNKIHLLGRMVDIKVKNKKTGKMEDKKEHVKGLLYFKPEFSPTDDFSCILYDLKETCEKANLTPVEKFVLEQMQNGSTKVEVALRLNTHHVKIVRTMEIIATKVARLGNKYDRAEVVQ